MTGHAKTPRSPVRGFRVKLLIAMMLVASAVTALALYLAERNLAANIERELQRDFLAELTALQHAQEVRHAALVERCRALVRKPRIHAALEDNALDLLYPSAEDELRDVMAVPASDPATEPNAVTRSALFYRFLDRTGHLIPVPSGAPTGVLPAAIEARLTLPAVTDQSQRGYFADANARSVMEVIATPIVSTDTGEPIAALVLGFKPLELAGARELARGFWTNGQLFFPALPPASRAELAEAVANASAHQSEGRVRLQLDQSPQLVFFKRVNPGSAYPPAFEVSLYPLSQFDARETQLRLQVLALGALLFAGAFFASHVLSGRLSAPVEQLAVESERSARFSADASHQLKTPVTVLRAGLEELLSREHVSAEDAEAISALVHQTYRLSSLIDDLLLLSRMDSGRLQLSLAQTDLRHLIDSALDDLSATPDALHLEIETDVPESLQVQGDARYTAIILQNLLENARKYNRPAGRIRIAARIEGEAVRLTVANTGRPIAPAAQAHIFERFHRGAMGEDVPGYGLGLNLARELARLHHGELRLVRSDAQWTEFEVSFRVARAALIAT